jgi:hypothetical protein
MTEYVVDARPSASGDSFSIRVHGAGNSSVCYIEMGALDQVIHCLQRLRSSLAVSNHLATHQSLSAAQLDLLT